MTHYLTPPFAPLTPLAADTIPLMWRAIAAAYRDRILLRHGGRSYSYSEIDERSARLAKGLLAQGAGKGSRIGILAPNGPDFVAAWLATNRIGALAIGLSTMFSAPELAYAVRHADISILISANSYLRHDYVDRIETAFPELRSCDGAGRLALRDAPYLREIWFTNSPDRKWARGRLSDLEEAGASSMFDTALLSAIEDQVAPSDLGVLIYTSGSTAHPKGVLHTHANLVRKPVYMGSDKGMVPFDLRPDDRMVVPMPFFWVGGLLSLTHTMLYGACVVCVDDGSPETLLKALREEEATQLAVAEPVLVAIQDLPGYADGDFERLRPQNPNQFAFFMGDASLRARAPVAFGMTETYGPHTGDITGALLPVEAAGSFCRPIEGMELKIVDPDTGAILPPGQVGELCVRGRYLMDGMYKRERADVFDADGFYHTGDGCRISSGGYLYFDSRISGMIKTSGANVSPEEVEVAIAGLGEVTEVAVMGVADPRSGPAPDPTVGQIVVAAIVRKAGSSLTEQDVRDRLKDKISGFKVPRRVFFFDYEDLPRTPSNKIRKPPLAETISKIMSEQT